MQKITALLICFVMLFTLPSCAAEEKERERVGGIQGEEGVYDTALLELDGVSVAFDEFRYYYLNYRDMYLEEDADYFTREGNEEKLKNEILSLLKDSAAVRLLAEKNGVRLTKKEKKAVLEDLEKTRDFYEDKDAFYKSLSDSYMTEDLWVEMMEYSALYLKLFNKLYKDGGSREWTDKEFYDYFSKHYLAVCQIFLPYEEGESKENHEKTLSLAEPIYQRAANGEDFWSLVKECGKDDNMLDFPDGYYFAKGQAEDVLYEASAALEVGQISRPVAGETGLYLIKRMELKELRMNENRQTALYGYTDSYDVFHPGAYDEDFQAFYRERANKIDPTLSPFWEKINTKSVY